MAKLDLNRIDMPRQDPKIRAKNYKEVALGYSPEEAKQEASRCIQCKKRNCTVGCPVGVDIPEFIKALREDNLPEAVKALKIKIVYLEFVVEFVLRNLNVNQRVHLKSKKLQ